MCTHSWDFVEPEMKGLETMAFKVLNEDEIALLSDDQKKQYDEELSIYQERIAFVEQIEMLEKVEIPPYEAQLKEIAVIGDILRKNYAVNKDELGAHGIPECFRPTGVEVNYFKTTEAVSPELPVISYPKKVELLFSVPELFEPQLPFAKVSFQNIFDTRITEVNSSELPFVKVFFGREFTFKMDKPGQPILPEARVAFGNIPVFQGFKVNQPQIPVVDSPNCMFRKEANIPVVHADIPSVKGMEKILTNKIFSRPELPDVKVPQITKSVTDSYEFRISKHTVAELPDILRPVCSVKPVEAKQYSRTKLPEVQKPVCRVREKQVKQYNGTELPAIKQVSIVSKEFQAPEMTELVVACVKLPVANPPKFGKIDSNVKGLPNILSVEIPDVYAKWKALLPVENELRTLEEVNS